MGVSRLHWLSMGICLGIAAGAIGATEPSPLPTNIDNFFMRGTQPGMLATDANRNNDITVSTDDCIACHSGDPFEVPIFHDWQGSLMAQAARDPVFYACLDIAERDAPGSGDICIRCHVPKAWLEGRSTPTSGAMIQAADRDGVTCNFCHRLVDPFNGLGAPSIDAGILFDLGTDAPVQSTDLLGQPGFSGSASYVVDPFDRRRGPFPVQTSTSQPIPPYANCRNFHRSWTSGQCEDALGAPVGCETYESPLHRSANLCSTCHDVSTPHFRSNSEGTAFLFNGTGVNHPDGNKYNMVPIERTYSEWHKSAFAQGMGVDMGGRFGGEGQSQVSICQDCHMPVTYAQGCFLPNYRDDLPHHFLSGGSGWQLAAIDQLYGDDPQGSGTGETSSEAIRLNIRRNQKMLRCAADLDATVTGERGIGDELKVRVTNQTGHKLPSGYPEGRRIWLTVQYYDCVNAQSMDEYGHYDFGTAELDTSKTKVYEMQGGIDAPLAAMLGTTAGPAPHFVLTNAIFKDNRIPPRGFTNTGFTAVQAAPVGYTFADGQYWDDSYFVIPPYATGVRVILYYQATSKEYIEFLRDQNPHRLTNPTGNAGQVAYDLWLDNGMSEPVEMAVFPARPPGSGYDPCGDEELYAVCNCPPGPDPMIVDPDADGLFDLQVKGDVDGDRLVTVDDIPLFVQVLLGVQTDARLVCAADMNNVDGPNGADIQPFATRLMSP